MVNSVDLAPVTERVLSLVGDILARNGAERDIRADEALVDAGLTSLDLVNLMLAVESAFDIMIPPAQLSPSNFQSAASVSRMVVSVLVEDGALKVA